MFIPYKLYQHKGLCILFIIRIEMSTCTVLLIFSRRFTTVLLFYYVHRPFVLVVCAVSQKQNCEYSTLIIGQDDTFHWKLDKISSEASLRE